MGSGKECRLWAANESSPVEEPKVENVWLPQLQERNKLPRDLSLKSRKEIDYIFRHGQRFSGSCFYGMYIPDKEFRYAILVSKGLGNAPERNRIKRHFREAIRLGGKQSIGTGRVLILPQKDSKSIGFEPIKESLCRALERVKKSTLPVSGHADSSE